MKQGSRGRRRRLAVPFTIFTAALLALGVAAGSASAATATFTNSAHIGIPDSGTASPYPSTINATGFAGNLQKATVTLNGFTHTCPEDLSVLLVGPSGAKTILMGNVGSCPQTDIGLLTLTFDQAAAGSIDNVNTVVSGTYKPSEDTTNFEGDLGPPAPPGPYPVDLNALNGGPANGTWSLYIDDCCAEDQGAVNSGWSLNLTAPVNSLKAGKPKLNKKNGSARIPVTVGDAGTLTLRGKGVKTRNARVGAPGTVNLVVKPKGKAAKQLSSNGAAKVKTQITFTPTGGTSSTTTKKLKLKKG
ncbi:MAG: proprotein convertase P-domain-containing protein [Acidimicrobiaceae bacterium]|nr:proprotein convertase P-domain-containing protein [Acidimicrobiaceae bacterium]